VRSLRYGFGPRILDRTAGGPADAADSRLVRLLDRVPSRADQTAGGISCRSGTLARRRTRCGARHRRCRGGRPINETAAGRVATLILVRRDGSGTFQHFQTLLGRLGADVELLLDPFRDTRHARAPQHRQPRRPANGRDVLEQQSPRGPRYLGHPSLHSAGGCANE
jgi:hypothetical protein